MYDFQLIGGKRAENEIHPGSVVNHMTRISGTARRLRSRQSHTMRRIMR
jgi:hypothetical protein